jgi:hypothetical protein
MKVATLRKTLDSRSDIDIQSGAWILSHEQEPLLEDNTLQQHGIQEGSILSIHHQKDRFERNNERYWQGDAAEIRMDDGSLGLGLLVGYEGREHTQVMWIDFTQNTLSDFATVRATLNSQGILSHVREIFLTDRITTYPITRIQKKIQIIYPFGYPIVTDPQPRTDVYYIMRYRYSTETPHTLRGSALPKSWGKELTAYQRAIREGRRNGKTLDPPSHPAVIPTCMFELQNIKYQAGDVVDVTMG